MPWIIGIDEAGYGPNLGPFVMTSVACRIPPDLAQPDLWKVLKAAVRRYKERDDGRLLIEDSKVVYSTARGLKTLERGVLATLLPFISLLPGGGGPGCAGQLSLSWWIDLLSPHAHLGLRQECWYTGKTLLPLEADAADVQHAAERFQRACRQAGVSWGGAWGVIICPPRFNGLLERWGSKSVVLMVALTELLRKNLSPGLEGTDAVWVFVDKHGGRNHYGDVLKQVAPDGNVVVREEGGERSVYQITGLQRELQPTFQPRAEAEWFWVALASMLAKYLRELLMREFNGFWRQHLPDLKPTAGYPTDAARFLEAIRPVAAQLGIAEGALWRRK